MRYLFIILLALGLNIKAQTVVIEDEGIKQCLLDNYPTLIASDSTLILTEAANFPDSIACDGYFIQDISSLVHFDNIWKLSLDCVYVQNLDQLAELNNLSVAGFQHSRFEETLDLSGCNKLNLFSSYHSALTEFPTFNSTIKVIQLGENELTQVEGLEQYPLLTSIILNENKITSISGYENIPSIQSIYMSGNKLKEVPSFANNTSLQVLHIGRNDLIHVEGLEDKPNLKELHLQRNNLEDLPDFGNTTRPDRFLAFVNNFTFEDLLPVTEWSNFSNDIGLTPQNSQGEAESLTLYEGETWEWELTFDNAVESNYYLWYKDGALVDSTREGILVIDNLDESFNGAYTCEVKNTAFIDLTIDVKAITISVVPFEGNEEPAAFSPDGDGYLDDFYLEYDGQAIIYNELGQPVKHLSTPTRWDGTNDDGNPAPFGYYVIMVNGNKKIGVTLLR